MDKRYDTRTKLHRPVIVYINPDLAVTGYVTDISREGIGLDVEVHITIPKDSSIDFDYIDRYLCEDGGKKACIHSTCNVKHSEPTNKKVCHIGGTVEDPQFTQYVFERETAIESD